MATHQSPWNVAAVGKRKSSIARVYLKPRSGASSQVLINGREIADYFPRPTHRMMILSPFETTKTQDQFDVYVNLVGGGSSGQASAMMYGLAKALLHMDSSHREILKKAGMLTRDAREVERKKYGLSGARKRYQYSKR